MIQQVLTMATTSDSLRSDANGWTCEDPRLLVHGKPIGCTHCPKFPYTYDTPFHAMNDGWHLLGPPVRVDDFVWSWWFVREVQG